MAAMSKSESERIERNDRMRGIRDDLQKWEGNKWDNQAQQRQWRGRGNAQNMKKENPNTTNINVGKLT